MSKQTRRKYTDEFKDEAVKLIRYHFCCWLVAQQTDDQKACDQCLANGNLAASPATKPDLSI